MANMTKQRMKVFLTVFANTEPVSLEKIIKSLPSTNVREGLDYLEKKNLVKKVEDNYYISKEGLIYSKKNGLYNVRKEFNALYNYLTKSDMKSLKN